VCCWFFYVRVFFFLVFFVFFDEFVQMMVIGFVFGGLICILWCFIVTKVWVSYCCVRCILRDYRSGRVLSDMVSEGIVVYVRSCGCFVVWSGSGVFCLVVWGV